MLFITVELEMDDKPLPLMWEVAPTASCIHLHSVGLLPWACMYSTVRVCESVHSLNLTPWQGLHICTCIDCICIGTQINTRLQLLTNHLPVKVKV